MSRHRLLKKILSGSQNVRFNDMVALAEAFGFRLSRVSGSHHIFVHPQVRELVNLSGSTWAGQALSDSPVPSIS
jgi:predicted RNA binding protein YcfA (HicA-like mRNA interferase family)